MIIIRTSLLGNRGIAQAHVGGKSYSAEGRTIANEMSNLCSRLARVKDLVGQSWQEESGSPKGIVGQSARTKERLVSVEKSLPLVGGQMRGRVGH